MYVLVDILILRSEDLFLHQICNRNTRENPIMNGMGYFNFMNVKSGLSIEQFESIWLFFLEKYIPLEIVEHICYLLGSKVPRLRRFLSRSSIVGSSQVQVIQYITNTEEAYSGGGEDVPLPRKLGGHFPLFTP